MISKNCKKKDNWKCQYVIDIKSSHWPTFHHTLSPWVLDFTRAALCHWCSLVHGHNLGVAKWLKFWRSSWTGLVHNWVWVGMRISTSEDSLRIWRRLSISGSCSALWEELRSSVMQILHRCVLQERIVCQLTNHSYPHLQWQTEGSDWMNQIADTSSRNKLPPS